MYLPFAFFPTETASPFVNLGHIHISSFYGAIDKMAYHISWHT